MRQADILHRLTRLSGDGVVIPPEIADPARDRPTLIAFGALLRPLVAGAGTVRLHVVGADNVGRVPRGDTNATRHLLKKAILPRVTASLSPPAPSISTPGASFSRADDKGVPDTAVPPTDGRHMDGLPAHAPPSDASPTVASAADASIGSIWASVVNLWAADG